MATSTATPSPMKNEQPEPELSLSQLLDALERMVDNIAGTNRSQTDAAMFEQVVDAIPRISDICRKAKNLRNSLAPINKLPPETLALVAAFVEPGRELIDATAVCRYWRTTLLSFPRLWNRIDFSHWAQFRTYLERSKSVPLEVLLRNPSPFLLELLVPYTSRLASLTVWANTMSDDFTRVAHYLQKPIPALRKFGIIMPFGGNGSELPPGTSNNHLLHVRELELRGVPWFRAPNAFPHVIKLTWHVASRSGDPLRLAGLLDTLEQLPLLERVHLTFPTSQYYNDIPAHHVVTLPHVHQVSLSCPKGGAAGIPPILEFLKLPNLTSLAIIVDMPSIYSRSLPNFPITSFGEHLPNFVQLPEMGIHICDGSGQISFRSPSQAVLEYRAIARGLGMAPYLQDREFWGGIPLHTVRKVTAALNLSTKGMIEDTWLLGLLCDLSSLEHLELEGQCSYILRHLRQIMIRRDTLLGLKTLTVRSGAFETRQALRLKEAAEWLGLEIIVTCTPDPEVPDFDDERDSEGWSESWEWSDEEHWFGEERD